MDRKAFISAMATNVDKPYITMGEVFAAVVKSRQIHTKRGNYNIWCVMEEFLELIEAILSNDHISILEELADGWLSVVYLMDYFSIPLSNGVKSAWKKADTMADCCINITSSVQKLSKLLLHQSENVEDTLGQIMGSLNAVQRHFAFSEIDFNLALRTKVNRELERIS